MIVFKKMQQVKKMITQLVVSGTIIILKIIQDDSNRFK